MDDFERSLARVLSFAARRESLASTTAQVCPSEDVLKDVRFIPVLACAASVILLLLTGLVTWVRGRKSGTVDDGKGAKLSTMVPERGFVGERGGAVIFGLHVARLVGAVALLGLSVSAVVLGLTSADGEGDMSRGLSCGAIGEIGLMVAYGYAVLTSLLAIVFTGTGRRTYDKHAHFALFVQFAVFAWRNILPLATFDSVPADSDAAWLMWSRGVLVALVGLAIPLVVPNEYRPVDPLNPAVEPNPEQTASFLSFIFFIFLEPIVLAAYRLPHFTYDNLPPLPDTDWSTNLVRVVDDIDPVQRKARGLKERHVIYGLSKAFGWDYVRLGLIVISLTLSWFLIPIAMNRLLTYIETGGENAVVQPWAWILLLFCSGQAVSILFNVYIFITTRMVTQCENIMIQLIFRQSLRVRVSGEQSVTANSDTKTATDTPASKSPSVHIAARVANLIGTDMGNITQASDIMFLFVGMPLETVIAIWYLYRLLGLAAIIGMGSIILLSPVPGMITRQIDRVQAIQIQKTDERLQAITESLAAIRMVKMFGWEKMITQQIAARRDVELDAIKKRKLLTVMLNVISGIIPLANMILVYAFYTVVMHKVLDAATVFSTIPVFQTLESTITSTVGTISDAIQARVSLNRVNDFVSDTNLLDKFGGDKAKTPPPAIANDTMGFHNASFTWNAVSTSGLESEERSFRLQIDDLVFHKESLNIIVGPTGCGKTAALMALLGEMHFEPSGPDAWYNLPRGDGVAYAAQESWVQNDTIKNNILFGEPLDTERYKQVLYQCALQPDLALFEAGDETEVGERGLTLSGGQKARLTLARAVYSTAGVVLVDDVLSALDVHTARWVVEKCLQGDLLSKRTVVLVTHALALAGPVARKVISLDAYGHILSQGPLSKAVLSDVVLQSELQQSTRSVEVAESLPASKADVDTDKPDGKLVTEEELAEGRLHWNSTKLLLGAFGGSSFWALLVLGFLVVSVADVLGTWWIGIWADSYEASPNDVNAPYYVSILVLIQLGAKSAVSALVVVFYTLRSIRASRKVHDVLCQSVFGATLRWLDTTPVGRITSRFTQDITEVDGSLSNQIPPFVRMTLDLLMKCGAVILISPPFILPAICLAILGMLLGRIYVNAQMTLKRMRSKWKSPLYNHFDAAVVGTVSIRAYGAEESFQKEIAKRLDEYSRPSRTFLNLSRWISARADFLASLFGFGLALYLVYVRRTQAGRTGFSLSMAGSFSRLILSWVEEFNDLEIAGNSVERIQNYLTIDHEPFSTEMGTPSAYWPASGTLKVQNLCARYSPDGPLVLDQLTFEVKSGERVGIVGRTGSGKSSLALALLRLLPTTGSVLFDGLTTAEINLESLRAAIGMIPQEPILMSGSLRINLDPSMEHSDAILNDALRAVGLIGRIEGHVRDDITLDTNVAHGGSNFSVGERQLIALARAIVRRPKILILDEATASIDMATDFIIQKSLADNLKGTTLLTIAHRLQTIMDHDRILVLDAGRIAEFNSPLTLLEDENSRFSRLVNESGQREKLWELARRRAAR